MLPMLPLSYNLKCIMNKTTLKTVYHALIESRFSYGIIFWGASYKSHAKTLIKLITKIQTILGIENDVLDLNDLFFKRSCLFFFKRNSFKEEIVQSKLRNLNIIPIKPNLELIKQQCIYTKYKLFNSLPKSLKIIDTLPKFKRLLCDYIDVSNTVILNTYKT